jgi:hypothetical protein
VPVPLKEETLMPFLNGRFYMNPIFGAALERARRANVGREWSEESPQAAGQAASASGGRHRSAHAAKSSGAKHKGHTGDDYDPATTTEGIANQIYNETAGLRTTARQGPGSDVDLQEARRAIGGALYFYFDDGRGPPKFAEGKKPAAVFGPFLNEAGGGDVGKGKSGRVVIIR